MSESHATPAPKKRSPLLTALILTAAAFAIVTGVMQVLRGFGVLGSGLEAEVKRLLDESDAALARAVAKKQDADALFQDLLQTVDTEGLATARANRRESDKDVGAMLTASAEQFRLAARKIDEALTHELPEEIKSFVTAKARGYNLFAEVCDRNREILRLILDESIATAELLFPQVNAIAQRRDAAQKSAEEAFAQAESIIAAKKPGQGESPP